MQLPTLNIDRDEVRKGESPAVLLKRRLHTAFGRVRDAIGHAMLEDDIGYPCIRIGCQGRVVIAPQEPGFCVKSESLDAAVDWQIGSIVGFHHAVGELRPFDIGSHQLVGERVVAPKSVAQEIQKIQPVPFGAEVGILQVLPGVGALLEDPAVRRLDHHAEAIENTNVAGVVDWRDDGIRALNTSTVILA